jgi:hypothetical protein
MDGGVFLVNKIECVPIAEQLSSHNYSAKRGLGERVLLAKEGIYYILKIVK